MCSDFPSRCLYPRTDFPGPRRTESPRRVDRRRLTWNSCPRRAGRATLARRTRHRRRRVWITGLGRKIPPTRLPLLWTFRRRGRQRRPCPNSGAFSRTFCGDSERGSTIVACRSWPCSATSRPSCGAGPRGRLVRRRLLASGSRGRRSRVRRCPARRTMFCRRGFRPGRRDPPPARAPVPAAG